MRGVEVVREGLTASLAGPGRARAVGDRLCGACVDLLDVDGAALSVIQGGVLSRSFAASSPMSRDLDELQFTLGEGPCWDAVRDAAPVLIADLDDPATHQWPGFAGQALQRGVRAVFALPIFVARLPIGALDLYRSTPGDLDGVGLAGGLVAAELAALPLLDLLGLDLAVAIEDESSNGWAELTALTRVEVYQAAGMVIAQLGVSAAEALVRIRGYGYAHDMTASEVAYQILERGLRLTDDHAGKEAPTEGSSA